MHPHGVQIVFLLGGRRVEGHPLAHARVVRRQPGLHADFVSHCAGRAVRSPVSSRRAVRGARPVVTRVRSPVSSRSAAINSRRAATGIRRFADPIGAAARAGRSPVPARQRHLVGHEASQGAFAV